MSRSSRIMMLVGLMVTTLLLSTLSACLTWGSVSAELIAWANATH